MLSFFREVQVIEGKAPTGKALDRVSIVHSLRMRGNIADAFWPPPTDAPPTKRLLYYPCACARMLRANSARALVINQTLCRWRVSRWRWKSVCYITSNSVREPRVVSAILFHFSAPMKGLLSDVIKTSFFVLQTRKVSRHRSGYLSEMYWIS